MHRVARWMALFAIVALLAAACGGGDEGGGGSATPTSGGEGIPTGGTILLASTSQFDGGFDPQLSYYSLNWQFYEAMLRTLVSYEGVPAAEGGNELQPDIAAALPEVSADGLTWTFALKTGVKYAPPFQDVEVTCGDFVRSFEREADPDTATSYPFYYSVIEGWSEFADGKADTISGISCPDDQTIVFTLTQPTGDFGYRVSMPAVAPIPPLGDKRYGAAEGHERDWGPIFVATGPYMIAGVDQLDYNAAKVGKPSGYVANKSLQLVRNPSWDPATDDLRPAYVDGFDLTIGGEDVDLQNKVLAGELDYALVALAPDQLRQYATDPNLQDRLYSNPGDSNNYVSMNMAIPPFDDIHVRKAVNYALDKSGMIKVSGGPMVGTVAGHIFPDGLVGGLLADYNPYATPNDAGDVNAAKEEMKQSKYDSNGDGVCDADVCKGILANTDSGSTNAQKRAAIMAENLKAIGLELDVRALDRSTMYDDCNTPDKQVALCLDPGWIKDYADAFTFADPLFGSASLGPDSCCNYTLVGATPQQLKGWGYTVTQVPNLNDKMAECAAQTGDPRLECYANLDKYLMEEVVPWVPRVFGIDNEAVSARVAHASYGQFSGGLALTQFAIATDQQ